jgi:threonine synthase
MGARSDAVRYISTRGQAPDLEFEDVMLAGLAADGGLYVPESWPTLTAGEIAALRGLPYAELAARVMQPFIGQCIPPADLHATPPAPPAPAAP